MIWVRLNTKKHNEGVEKNQILYDVIYGVLLTKLFGEINKTPDLTPNSFLTV